jgi:hypothetical protein
MGGFGAFVENRSLIVIGQCTEFMPNAKLEWIQSAGIAWHFIAPGKPAQNGILRRPMPACGTCC